MCLFFMEGSGYQTRHGMYILILLYAKSHMQYEALCLHMSCEEVKEAAKALADL